MNLHQPNDLMKAKLKSLLFAPLLLCSFATEAVFSQTQSTTDLPRSERDGAYITVPVAASTHVYSGTMAAINASGYAVAASDTASLNCLGKFDQEGDNSTGGNGAISVRVKRGTFAWAVTGSNTPTAANVGQVVYVSDDHTVTTSSSHSISAGILIQVDNIGAWVDSRYLQPTVGAPASASVTTTSLNTGVSNLIFATTVAVANTGSPDGVAHVSGQVTDCKGNSLTGSFLVRVVLSSTSYGAPNAQSGTLAALSGSTILNSNTANCDVWVLSKTDGTWGVNLTTSSDPKTVYAYAACGTGKFAIANATITGG
jgi:hypothetical protein